MDENQLNSIQPDNVFDGGDMDCGSGLILLIRENMLKVPEGGVLEMRSHEPTVADDLPPWCRMVGHKLLGTIKTPEFNRYFIERGISQQAEEQTLAADKQKAREYEWRLRARSAGQLHSKIYCRNFSFDVGQPASFEEKDKFPSAVEYMLGAIAGALTTGFATECAKCNLTVDDIEITAKAQLANVLAHMGLEDGDPGFANIEIKCFASTFDDDSEVRAAWQRTLDRSPLVATIQKGVPQFTTKLAIV